MKDIALSSINFYDDNMKILLIYTLFKFEELTELRPLIDLKKDPFCEPVDETRVLV